jgi:hypothetical protein
MPWTRLDDELATHQKLHQAGRDLGENGRVIALGFFSLALMWCNKHLTDGYLPDAVIDGFTSHVSNPQNVAEALSKAGLFERNEGGYHIHDFHDYNQSAETVRKRRKDRHLGRATATVPRH